jgi:DNA-directed RNA polymerase subunit RPC12/RpoP
MRCEDCGSNDITEFSYHDSKGHLISRGYECRDCGHTWETHRAGRRLNQPRRR